LYLTSGTLQSHTNTNTCTHTHTHTHTHTYTHMHSASPIVSATSVYEAWDSRSSPTTVLTIPPLKSTLNFPSWFPPACSTQQRSHIHFPLHNPIHIHTHIYRQAPTPSPSHTHTHTHTQDLC